MCARESRNECAHTLIGKSVGIQTTSSAGNAVFGKFVCLSANAGQAFCWACSLEI